eukprot:RCo018602
MVPQFLAHRAHVGQGDARVGVVKPTQQLHQVVRPLEVGQRDIVAAHGVADQPQMLVKVGDQRVVDSQGPAGGEQGAVVVQQSLLPLVAVVEKVPNVAVARYHVLADRTADLMVVVQGFVQRAECRIVLPQLHRQHPPFHGRLRSPTLGSHVAHQGVKVTDIGGSEGRGGGEVVLPGAHPQPHFQAQRPEQRDLGEALPPHHVALLIPHGPHKELKGLLNLSRDALEVRAGLLLPTVTATTTTSTALLLSLLRAFPHRLTRGLTIRPVRVIPEKAIQVFRNGMGQLRLSTAKRGVDNLPEISFANPSEHLLYEQPARKALLGTEIGDGPKVPHVDSALVEDSGE